MKKRKWAINSLNVDLLDGDVIVRVIRFNDGAEIDVRFRLPPSFRREDYQPTKDDLELMAKSYLKEAGKTLA